MQAEKVLDFPIQV